jgi:outer membrane protein insertion porin family
MLRLHPVVRAVLTALALVVAPTLAVPAFAQIDPCSAYEPADKPVVVPVDSKPLLRCLQLYVHPNNETVIDANTYNYYIKMPRSNPDPAAQTKLDKWVAYDEDVVLADFDNLWKTGFLDNLWIEVIDEPFANGVMGKHVVFHMEERSRLKVIDYVSTTPKQRLKVEVSKIEETLKEKGIALRYDTFVDLATIRKVKAVIQNLYAEKGYQAATIDPVMTALEGGPKLVRLTFNIASGPEVKIREIHFDGAKAFSNGKLVGQMKDNKPKTWLSFITDAGTYQEAKFGDDAEKVRDYYNNKGYVRAQLGTPQIETIEDTKDGKTRWIRLNIPIDEGEKYRIGKFEIAGNTTVKAEAIRPMFKVKEGEFYSRKKLMKGLEEVRKVYGMFGYFEASPIPEFCFRGIDCETGKPIGTEKPPNIVDIKMQMNEGKQFFVHRITFLGNTTTRDNVIRREMRVWEGHVFNSEALKDSVKRLNQLGYFKPLESAEAIQVEPTAGTDNQVDVRLKFEEQNRNQLAFGAGVSQFDGFFGQLSFQTSNFLGRGETVGVSLQKGGRAKNYQISFSEPYLFDRPITAGIDIYSRQYIFPLNYTQDETGGNTVVGMPIKNGYSRAFLGYSYARIKVHDINPAYLDPNVLAASPYLAAQLLINEGGHRSVSKVSPSYVYNTVNQPIFPSAGKRFTMGFDIAGVGGDTSYWSTNVEGIWYIPITPRRMSAGLRAQVQYAKPYGNTQYLPIFEKFFQGGEYSIRGFDIRSVGPRDASGTVVVGGNKSLLFNAEYYINVVGPVRFLFFYDAGQVRDIGEKLQWREPVITVINPPSPLITDPFNFSSFVDPNAPKPQIVTTGNRSAFRTSTGVELRFFMPVLNVPFRLIGAYNPQRFGVFSNNTGLLTKKFTFRFAVGTTF